MSDDPGRRFTREETALILRRATDADARPDAELDGGLTLDELAAAAREAGIDPAAVRRAAAIAPAPVDDFQAWALGAAAAPELRARFEGRFPTAARGQLQDAVERAIGRQGTVVDDKAAVVWHEEHGTGRTVVRVQTEGTTTVVMARADRRGHLILLVLALAVAIALLLQPLGGFAGLAALADGFVAAVAPVGVLLIATRALWPRLQRSTNRRLVQAILAVGALLEPNRET